MCVTPSLPPSPLPLSLPPSLPPSPSPSLSPSLPLSLSLPSYKFWTCCQRRTSDFDEFLRQEGCTKGDHKWIEVQSDVLPVKFHFHSHFRQKRKKRLVGTYIGLKVPSILYVVCVCVCRYDWHQTGTHVVVAFYAKACLPDECLFEANQTSVSTPFLSLSMIVLSATLSLYQSLPFTLYLSISLSLRQCRALLSFNNGKNQQLTELKFYGVSIF